MVTYSGTVTATYTDGTTNVFSQTLSDWCGFGGNQYESIAIGGGLTASTATAPSTARGCNSMPTLILGLHEDSGKRHIERHRWFGASFALAITLKPPTYTIDGGTAGSSTDSAGSSTTASVTVNPQPGYVGTIGAFVRSLSYD